MKSTFTVASRLGFNKISLYCALVKLTHKNNYEKSNIGLPQRIQNVFLKGSKVMSHVMIDNIDDKGIMRLP